MVVVTLMDYGVAGSPIEVGEEEEEERGDDMPRWQIDGVKNTQYSSSRLPRKQSSSASRQRKLPTSMVFGQSGLVVMSQMDATKRAGRRGIIDRSVLPRQS